MTLVNVGCGKVFHPEWVNLDYAPEAPEVRACDLRDGLPFASGSVDAVYHSHVLEHLDTETGRRFLVECRRVLRSGGILRVAVPDLEALVRVYLATIEDPKGPDPVMLNWLRLELIDQCVRTRSGGEMRPFVQALSTADLDRVRQRIGIEVDSMVSAEVPVSSVYSRLAAAGWRKLMRKSRTLVTRILVRIVGGRRLAGAFNEGLFRSTGEVHRCVYDRDLLGVSMTECGFINPRIATAGVSEIPRFAEFAIEVRDGAVRKPDSLFMEAVRP